MRIKWLAFILFAFFIFSCTKVPLYLEAEKPVWRENLVSNYPVKDSLKIVCYNIKFSLQVEKALEELRTIPDLSQADIILLQEMNEEGTQLIAKELGYNYVYYPIVYYTKHKRNFGNAVLSKYPILSDEKIVFPHGQSGNGSRRAATSVVVKIGADQVRVISAHLATIAQAWPKKKDQIDSLLRYSHADKLPFQIIGGDYNSLSGHEVNYVVNRYKDLDYQWASRKAGYTGTYLGGLLKPINDHIFTKGFELISCGKNEDITASDHYPIWTILRKQE